MAANYEEVGVTFVLVGVEEGVEIEGAVACLEWKTGRGIALIL